MTQWTVCPACGLRHSRGAGPCPRCGTAGGEARVGASASVAAPGGGQAAARPRRATAILAVIGVALLGAVASQVGRRAGAAAVHRLHWRDPALVRKEQLLERELAMLRSMQSSMEAYRASAAEDERALEARAAVLERAANRLADVSVDAGLELRARIPPRTQGSWTTTSIRVSAGREPSALSGVVARLVLPEGAWVEAARCSGEEGCSLMLSAATWAAPRPRAAGAAPAPQLPPRPWWPPSAKLWDRVRQGSEEAATLATSVNELYALRQRHDAAQLLELVMAAARNEAHRAAIGSVLQAAAAAGITDVDVARVGHGVQVQVPRRSPELVARLGALGQVVEDSGSGAAVTYALAFTRNQPRSYTPPSELPAGYSLGF